MILMIESANDALRIQEERVLWVAQADVLMKVNDSGGAKSNASNRTPASRRHVQFNEIQSSLRSKSSIFNISLQLLLSSN